MSVINTNTNLNFYTQQDLYAKNNINPEIFAAFNCVSNPLTSISPEKEYFASKKEKPTFKEAVKLFFRGARGRMKELANEIKQHPIRTALMVTGTMAVLSLLPAIGLTVGTGSAVLAAIFLLKAAVNIVSDISNIRKYSKNGDNYMLRRYIKKLGSDSFDMALVLPPIPKGLKQLKYQVKAGQAFKLNKEVISTFKDSGRIYSKIAKLITTNRNMLLEQSVNKKPLIINLIGKIKPFKEHINIINEAYHTLNSISNSLYSTFSTGLILAKRAKEFGIDDEYCQKASDAFVESVTTYSLPGRIIEKLDVLGKQK